MLDNLWAGNSGSRRNRARGFFRTFGTVVLLYGLFVARNCESQAADQAGTQLLYYQQVDQSQDQQSSNTQNQQAGQTQNQQTGQTQDQQSGETQDQQFGQMQDRQTGQTQDQQTGQSQGQQAGQTQNQSVGRPSMQRNAQSRNQAPVPEAQRQDMTAGQLISVLQQVPDVRESIEKRIVQGTGDGQGSMTDEELYERIRQDASLRSGITSELIKRGYIDDLIAINPGFLNNSGIQPQIPPYQNPNNPQAEQRFSPYRNMPSLSDLYSQLPASRTKLVRFGSEAFRVGAGNTNDLPIDLPAGPDYVLGPGDNLTVNMWGARSDRLARSVDRQGQIALPEAGTIMISGMTITEAQAAIQKALDTQFQGEHVELSLGKLRSVRVYVVGDVQRPGAYDVSSLSTPLSALYAAGGPTSNGSLRILRQYRSDQLVRQYDLYDFLLKGVRSSDDRLQSGDTIMVPPTGPQVSIEGGVRRPAIYELNGDDGLNQVLDLAGGALVSANLQQIRVERIEAHQSRTMFSLDLPDNQAEASEKLAAFKVRDGDDVIISQILPYNSQSVYLEGHVFRPGKYPYREGMTISDLLHSYQDVMPEPSDHAELVRLQSPDFRPSTTSFDLQDALLGNEKIALQPFDLIRIYGRYEIDSPSVTIDGEVLRPGKYPMSQGMTVSQLVGMAGGFRRSAYREAADLSSYVIQNGRNVELSHVEIAVQKAIDGDKASDLALKPGDVVSIRRLAGWEDIGATITITGEVEHPGGYGIQAGERLSSVLRRAGGFRSDAYPYAAIMQRVQVRELNEQARQQMIRRIEETPIVVNPGIQNSGAQSAADLQKSLESQRQQILTDLRSHPAGGRLVVNITSDIDRWANTPADIEVRAGDTLFIPKEPNFVMAAGQVYNPVAISYVPRKDFGWYYHKAGGSTPQGNDKELYVLRADGTIVPKQGRSWASNSFMSLNMRPGDTIFVPEKIQGASQVWQNIVSTAQIASAIMLPLAFAGVL